jgi:hypothetical protein
VEEPEATGPTAADEDAEVAEAEATGVTAAEEDAGVSETEAAGGATEDCVDEGDAEVWFWLPLPALDPEGRPEDVTRSESWSPAVIGPDGLAGQLPGGFRTCD